MIKLIPWHLAIVLMLCSGASFSQSKTPKFIVVNLPGCLGDKEKLNSAITSVRSEQELKKVFQSALSLDGKCISQRLEFDAYDKSGKRTRHHYNVSTNKITDKESVSSLVTLAGKSLENGVMENRKMLKEVFRDQLFVLKDLKLTMRLSDVSYEMDEYFVLAENPITGKITKQKVKSDNSVLVIDRSILPDGISGWCKISLRHSSQPDIPLGNCSIYFADADEIAEIQTASLTYKSDFPDKPDHELSLLIEDMIEHLYGRVYYPNLESFLKASKIIKSND